MTIPGPIASFWKKIQGHVYFEIIKLIALAVISIITPYVLRMIQRVRHVPQFDLLSSVILAVVTFCALLLTVIFFRGSQKDNGGTPKLVLSLGNLVWQYRATDNMTVIFILASLINKGEPSVAINWRVQYLVGMSVEVAEMYTIIGSYALDVRDTRITFTNENLLNLKTLETPIQKGQFVGGRIFFAIPGDRSEQIKSTQNSIEIQCEDYLGNVSTAKYQPSAKPATILLGHYKEKRDPIRGEGLNAVKQPASVSSTPEPPALGDGS